MFGSAGASLRPKRTLWAMRLATPFVEGRRATGRFSWNADTLTFILFMATTSCSTFPGSAKESAKEFFCAGWSRSKASSGCGTIAPKNSREEGAAKDGEKLQEKKERSL